ncbi:dihydropteroate synthase [Legionella israelensis]|nr:dihydropteroate synthase [Legionella israelensis]
MSPEQFIRWCGRSANRYSSNDWQRPLIMGVLNVTPDSFSDGGLYFSVDKACRRAEEMIAQGANIIDIGGESTRPGAEPVSEDEELSRVIPVIEKLCQITEHCISIDTSKPQVMKQALAAGAGMVNDVCALRATHALDVLSQSSVPICLMHMQETPRIMQNNPCYPDGIMEELRRFFSERISACLSAGIDKSRLILDPGFGFGKRVEHNLQLIKQIDRLAEFKLPLLLGVSRKNTIGSVLSRDVSQRMIGSVVATLYAALKGVSLIRTHDVDETHQALLMMEAISNAGSVGIKKEKEYEST